VKNKYPISVRIVESAIAAVLFMIVWSTMVELLNSDSDVEFRFGCVGVVVLVVCGYHVFRWIWRVK